MVEQAELDFQTNKMLDREVIVYSDKSILSIRSISRGNPNAQQHGANERKVNEEHVPVFADDIALLPPKPLLKRCLVPFAHGK